METAAIYATLLYLLAFRLAVIALGALCIYLGYRLFLQGFSGAASGTADGATLGAKFAGHELTLKNAAPGTFFAAFGALITISILATSPPEFTVKQRNSDAQGQPAEVVTALRGEAPPREPGAPMARVWHHYDLAVQALDEALAATPDDAAALELQAALAMVEGSEAGGDKALKALERARQADPAGAQRLARLASLYRQQLGR